MNKSNIPNIITAARMLLVAPLLMSMLAGNYTMAFYLFMAAGFSDGLDGYLARQFHWKTRMGAILDPLADKLLIMSSFLALAWLGHFPLLLVAVVVGRDAIIVSGATAAYYILKNAEFEPTRISKWNTCFQIALIFFTLFQLGFHPLPPGLIFVLMLTVLVTSTYSLVNYVWVWGMKAYQRKK